MMKKAFIIIWCFLYVFLACACGNGEPSLPTQTPTGTADTVATSPTAAITPSQNTEPIGQEEAYKSIACEKITDFQELTFVVYNSRTKITVMFPKQWTLEKSDKGYSIVNASKVIGTVTAFEEVKSDSVKTLHSSEITMSGVEMTSRIDCVTSEGKESYVRALSYRYKEAEGKSRTITITMQYAQIDDDAAWKMMVKTKKYTSTDPKMNVLSLAGGRNSVLILGNSFISTSKIGPILQKMCGTKLSVEAQSRGYARITTYVQDESVMNRIRSGDYGAVILCGLYDLESVTNLEHMINACAESNTTLALFPAHNESNSLIGTAGMLHPSVLFLDWKAEIESLISSGIDETHFCIADSHKHSTPLAGYVGAHMIYRAIFGKVPGETSFSEVSKAEIALLGNYRSTGSVVFTKEENTYSLKAN